jgi:protein TonB
MALSDAPRYIPPPTNNRRVIGFGLVVAFHGLVIWAFASGLAQMVVDRIKGPMETRLIEEAKIEEDAPPPPPPKFQAPPPVFVDMPVVAITEAPAETSAIVNTTNVKPVAPPPPPKADVVILPRSNPRRPNTSTEEIYPAMSRRLGEEGSVILLLTVNEEGRVTEAKIQTSSGFDRLDEAASKEAVRSWRFLPGTINGKPSAMQYPLKVTFKLPK